MFKGKLFKVNLKSSKTQAWLYVLVKTWNHPELLYFIQIKKIPTKWVLALLFLQEPFSSSSFPCSRSTQASQHKVHGSQLYVLRYIPCPRRFAAQTCSAKTNLHHNESINFTEPLNLELNYHRYHPLCSELHNYRYPHRTISKTWLSAQYIILDWWHITNCLNHPTMTLKTQQQPITIPLILIFQHRFGTRKWQRNITAHWKHQSKASTRSGSNKSQRLSKKMTFRPKSADFNHQDWSSGSLMVKFNHYMTFDQVLDPTTWIWLTVKVCLWQWWDRNSCLHISLHDIWSHQVIFYLWRTSSTTLLFSHS